MSGNIYCSSQYLYYILKTLGLAPYHYDQKIQKFKVTIYNYIEITAVLGLWIFLTYIQLENLKKTYIKTGIDSNLLDLLWQDQYLM